MQPRALDLAHHIVGENMSDLSEEEILKKIATKVGVDHFPDAKFDGEDEEYPDTHPNKDLEPFIRKICNEVILDFAMVHEPMEFIADDIIRYLKAPEACQKDIITLATNGGVGTVIAELERADPDIFEKEIEDIHAKMFEGIPTPANLEDAINGVNSDKEAIKTIKKFFRVSPA